MANTVRMKRSGVAAKIPTTADLALGEIGINTFDGKLYIKKDNGTASIVEVGTGGSTISFGSTGLTPASPTSGAVTVAGTLSVASGGTGTTSLTGLVKGNGTAAFTAAVAGTDYLAPSAIGSTVQAQDADLSAIAGLAGTSGILTKTAANSWALDTSSYLTTAAAVSYFQPLDSGLTAIAGLAVTDGNIIVGNGSTWIAESGATARTSLGLGSAALYNTGTVAGTVPLCNGANTWSANQSFTGTIDVGKITATGTGQLIVLGSATFNTVSRICMGGVNAGTATPGVQAGLETQSGSTAARHHQIFANPNGVVGSISTSGSATAFNTSSDYRLKQDVGPIGQAIARLMRLRPVRFRWKADPAGPQVDGFLAHEAQEVVPEAVTGFKDQTDENGNPAYQGIDQAKLVPLLAAALQEAVIRIDALETRLAYLEAVSPPPQ